MIRIPNIMLCPECGYKTYHTKGDTSYLSINCIYCNTEMILQIDEGLTTYIEKIKEKEEVD